MNNKHIPFEHNPDDDSDAIISTEENFKARRLLISYLMSRVEEMSENTEYNPTPYDSIIKEFFSELQLELPLKQDLSYGEISL